VEPAVAGGAARPLSIKRATDGNPPARLLAPEAITGAAPAHSHQSDETAVVVVPDGENCTELRSVSSGRDLNTPTSQRHAVGRSHR